MGLSWRLLLPQPGGASGRRPGETAPEGVSFFARGPLPAPAPASGRFVVSASAESPLGSDDRRASGRSPRRDHSPGEGVDGKRFRLFRIVGVVERQMAVDIESCDKSVASTTSS